MAELRFLHGNPLMVDYTPGTAVAAGEGITPGNEFFCICHTAIAANELGALAAGGGVYEGTADAAITVGAKVYFDPATAKVTITANAANDHIGWALTASAADGDAINVLHRPDGTASA